MANLTRNISDKSQVKIDGVISLQAANGDGEAILEEMIKFSKGNKYVTPTVLNYTPASKCWTNRTGKIVLFNIAVEPTPVVIFVKSYMKGEQGSKAKTDPTNMGGFLATDTGVVLTTDTVSVEGENDKTQALKIDTKK